MKDKLTLQERILCADLSEIDWNHNVNKSKSVTPRRQINEERRVHPMLGNGTDVHNGSRGNGKTYQGTQVK